MSQASDSSLSIAIAGAGLLGRLLAWRLSLLGHRVELFEAGSFSQQRSAAHTAAAMISPLSEVVISDRSIYDLGLESLALWPHWIDELNNTLNNPSQKLANNKTFKPIQYSANGSIIVAHPQDHAELMQFKHDLQRKLGHDDNSTWLDSAALKEKEPQIDHFHQGLFLPDEAFLDNRQLLNNVFELIKLSGVICHENTHVELKEKAFLKKYDWVFDCRGLGRKEVDLSIRGVRGEVMWVETKEVQLSHPIRLCHPRYKLYVVPKPNHQFIIGATEIESEDTSPISLQSTLELSSALYTINPAFAEARVIETDVNLRPAYLNNLPKIEKDNNVISINGLYRHGYLLAPALIEQSLKHLTHY